MNKTSVTILLGFLVMFAAGAVVGMVQHHGFFRPPPPGDRSWLGDQLQLSEAQKQQMQQIWSDVMPHNHDNHDQGMDKRHILQKQRNDAIRALLTPQQQKQFDQIEDKYEADTADLQKERGKAVQEAIAKTKLILNDTQRAKYEEILKRREVDHQGWENGHHPTSGPFDGPPPP
jgi:hypothetical protein